MLRDVKYDTLVIEVSFIAIDRTVEFRLLERGTIQPDELPGTHLGVHREAAATGIFAESTSQDPADLWQDHQARRLTLGKPARGNDTSDSEAIALLEAIRSMHVVWIGETGSRKQTAINSGTLRNH